jgi:hypothetical protein
MEPILVVDAGAATTMACLVGGPAGRPEPVLDEHSRDNHVYWPTAVAWGARGFLAGASAVQPGTHQGLAGGRFLLDPAQPDSRVPLGDRTYPRYELLAAMLDRLRRAAQDKARHDVTRILLTVPDLAAGGDAARRGLLQAARLAKFTDVELLPAGLAAAMAPAAAVFPGSHVLVCDAGASALRLVLVRTGLAPGTDPGVVRAVRLIPGLGGDAMDRAIADDLPGKAGRQRREDVAAWARSQRYLEPVTRGRERLSDWDKADISPDAIGLVPVTYTRNDLKRKLASDLDQVTRMCRAMLREPPLSGRPDKDLSAVLLVGGCAPMPFLAGELAKLKVLVQNVREPGTAILEGATRWAGHAAGRVIIAMPHRPGVRDLAWALKDSRVTLVEWRVAEGRAFARGERLAVVRSLDDDSVKYLTADFAGTMRQHCIHEKEPVESLDVVAIAEVRHTTREDLADPVYRIADLPGRRAVAFGRSGTELLLTGTNGPSRLLSLETGAEREVAWPAGSALGPHGAAAWDPDAGWVAGDFHDGVFEAYGENDARSRHLGSFDIHRQQPAIRLSGDGRLACLIDSRAEGRLADIARGLAGIERGPKVRIRPTARTSKELPDAPDGDFYASPSSSVAFSPDGAIVILALQASPGHGSQPRTPRLLAFHPQDGTHAVIRALPGSPLGARRDLSLQLAPDGSRVMVAIGGELEVRDVGSGEILWTVPPPPGPITAASFSARGDLLVIASQLDRQWLVTAWDVAQDDRRPGEAGRPLRQLLVDHEVTRLLVSPDDRFLVTGNDTDSTLWGLLP